jgi:hypothetical protein
MKTQTHFLSPVYFTALLVVAFLAISATDRQEYYYGNTVHVHDYVILKNSREEFFNKLKAENITFKKDGEFVFFNNERFERYVLNNVPLGSGTIHSAELGIREKGNKLQIYIEHIDVADKHNADRADNTKEFKKWKKKYRHETLDYFGNFN